MERKARFYYLINGALFRKTFLPVDARCLSQAEGILVLREAHEGECAEHAGFCSLARNVIRPGFFWPTMKKDTDEMVRKCASCQKHRQNIHVPATEMIAISSPCPFARWKSILWGHLLKQREGNRFW